MSKKKQNKAQATPRAATSQPLGNPLEAFHLFLERRPANRVVFALVYTLAFHWAVLSSVTPTFKVNDNGAIIETLMGGHTVSYMSLMLGKFLSWLYLEVSMDVPWYGYAMYFSTFVSFFMLAHGLSLLGRLRLYYLPLLLGFSFLSATFLIRTGYNASSILPGAAALFSLMVSTRRRKLRAWEALLLGLAFSLSLLVRLRGVQAVGIFLLPVLALWALAHLRRHGLSALVFFLPVMLFGLADWYWKNHWTSEAFEEYRAFNDLRGPLQGFPILNANVGNQPLLEANGWDLGDYEMFRAYLCFDEDLYNVRTLSNIHQMSIYEPEERLASFRWERLQQEFVPVMRIYFWAALLLLSLSLARFDWRNLGLFLAYALYVLGGIFYLRIFYRFPERIADPIAMMALLGLVFVLDWRFELEAPRRPRVELLGKLAFGALGFLLLARASDDIRREAEVSQELNSAFESNFDYLNHYFAGKTVMVQPALNMLDKADQNPFKVYRYTYVSIPSGWQTFSPYFYACLRRAGVERGSDLVRHSIDNRDFFYVFSDQGMKFLLDFTQRHYGIHCGVGVVAGQSIPGRGIYRLLTERNPDVEPGTYILYQVETPQEGL